MIKRVIEISREPAHLAVQNEQLLIQRYDAEETTAASIPCEDIGMVCIDHRRTTYSHHALATLARHGAIVVVCDESHLPSAMLIPLANHTELVPRIQLQTQASKPTLKRLWKQLVVAKVRAQADNIEADDPIRLKLKTMSDRIRSGDPSNIEAQAARAYWSTWLGPNHGFRRDQNGSDPINAMLNYGYAIMRASVARAIVCAGLVPAIGIHHHNRSNAFCLADDLLEPLRPLVDARVRLMHAEGDDELDQLTKAKLLDLLTTPCQTGDERGPLMVHLHTYTASLVRAYEGRGQKLTIPRPIIERD